MPLSQKRELDIERELAAIMRELDRHSPAKMSAPNKAEQAVQLPWAVPLLLDLDG